MVNIPKIRTQKMKLGSKYDLLDTLPPPPQAEIQTDLLK